MSEEVREDDEWLYEGGGGGDKEKEKEDEGGGEGGGEGGKAEMKVEGEGGEEEGDKEQDNDNGDASNEKDSNEDEDEDEDSEDDDDDGVNVVIDTKAAAAAGQTPFSGTGVGGVKRPAPADKKGKFSVEDFETPGTINGASALEFNIDGIEDKPWRKPGADITDYFNYGFTEETWRAYTERQKRMRFEAGAPQILTTTGPKPTENRGVITVAFGGHHQGPMHHRMDMMQRRRDEHRENTIQVMTADRREYSRKNFDMPMGPPPMGMPPFNPGLPPPNFPPPGHGPPPEFMNPNFFNHPPPEYYPEDHRDYEEQQWMDHHTESWDMGMEGPPQGSSTIVSLTKVSNVPPPPGDEGDRKD